MTADADYELTGMYMVDLQSPAAAVAAHPYGINMGAVNLLKLSVCALPNCDEIGTKAFGMFERVLLLWRVSESRLEHTQDSV